MYLTTCLTNRNILTHNIQWISTYIVCDNGAKKPKKYTLVQTAYIEI